MRFGKFIDALFAPRQGAKADEALARAKERVAQAGAEASTELDLSSLYHLEVLPSEISTLRSVRKISLCSTGVGQIDEGALPAGIEELDLSYCRNLRDISALRSLRTLRALNLSRTQVDDIRLLAELPALTRLDLNKSKVTDIEPLVGMAGLAVLDIGNTEVADFAPLAGCTGLTSLVLWNTTISDLGPLAGLKRLEALDLWNTPVTDVSPLAGLQQLRDLDLSHTGVTDIADLKGLERLERLALFNTACQAQSIRTGKYYGRWRDSDFDVSAKNGDLEDVKALAARGAMIHANDWHGPFHDAVRNGHVEVCRFMVSVDPTLLNEWAAYDEVYPPDTPLGLAIKHGQEPMIDFLLTKGADVLGIGPVWHGEWIGGYHLCCAVEQNDIVTLALLLERGVPVDAKDYDGVTALARALEADAPEALRLLVNAGRAQQGRAPLAPSAPDAEVRQTASAQLSAQATDD